MVCDQKAQLFYPRRDKQGKLTAPVTLADAMVGFKHIGFIGIVEMYHETLCLLAWQLVPALNTPITKPVLETRTQCRCDAGGLATVKTAGAAPETPRVVHHDGGHVAFEALNISTAMREKVDLLTGTDRQLFVLAFKDFAKRVLQVEAQLGYRFACDSALLKANASLGYLVPDLFELFNSPLAKKKV